MYAILVKYKPVQESASDVVLRERRLRFSTYDDLLQYLHGLDVNFLDQIVIART